MTQSSVVREKLVLWKSSEVGGEKNDWPVEEMNGRRAGNTSLEIREEEETEYKPLKSREMGE
jgi:hypothetical protein